MGSSLDISVGANSVGAQSGSDKATTASDSQGSYKVTERSSGTDSPNLDKDVLPANSPAGISDSESNQNSTPDNTLTALPQVEEYKGENVMRAALELAAAARMKAEKALSMRDEERSKETEKDVNIQPVLGVSREQGYSFSIPTLPEVSLRDISCSRSFDALADSMPRVSPTSSPRFHPQPQMPLPPAVVNQMIPAPATQRHPSPPPRHPSPPPARETKPSNRPFQGLTSTPIPTMPGAPGGFPAPGASGARSMTNLTQSRATRPGQHGPDARSPGAMRRTPAPSGTTNRPQFPQRMSAVPQPLGRRC